MFSSSTLSSACSVRSVPLDSLTETERRQWSELAEHSLEPNPFLAPEFVLPLVRSIPQEAPLVLVAVEARDRWVAAGVFEIRPISRWIRLTYARGLCSPYSFLDGLLVTADEGPAAVKQLLQAQCRRRDWHGFHFSALRVHSPVWNWLLAAGDSTGVYVEPVEEWVRAALNIHAPMTAEALLERCSKTRRKSLRRSRRRLEAYGAVHFRLTEPDGPDDPSVDNFLRLESLGWKGEAGTALVSDPAHEQFFRCMVAAQTPRRGLVFGELCLNEEVIASTCNLRSGSLLSAFKLGWDPAYADGSVGLWSELEFAAAVSQQYPEITRLDSCSTLGSYVESVWQDREPLVSLTCSWSTRGTARQVAKSFLRQLKNFTLHRRVLQAAQAVPDSTASCGDE